MTDFSDAQQASAVLEQVLADAREEAAVLRAHGHATQAKSIEGVVNRVAMCMASYLNTLSDSGAMLRSGWSVARLRARFPEWEAQGLAMLDEKGRRVYREVVVPMRPAREAVKLAAQRGGSLREAARAS